jgi:signal transduction histidine kinase
VSRVAFSHFARHRLTITAIVVLFLLLLTTFVALFRLLAGTAERERSAREKLFERDLHGFEGLFNEDTGYVLDHNLQRFLDPQRPVAPLILPRAYYAAGPAPVPLTLPARPPINCSLALRPVEGAASGHGSFPDRLCAYFAASPTSGPYLYLTTTFMDMTLVSPRKAGFDPGASGIHLSIRSGSGTTSWWLQIEAPSSPPASSGVWRSRLLAFRLAADGQFVPDARVDGWAYVERPEQAVQTVTIDGRVEFAGDTAQPWPPANWESMRIDVARRRVNPESGVATTTRFDAQGETVWSLPALLASFFDAHADVAIRWRLGQGLTESWTIGPTGVGPDAAAMRRHRVRLAGGDLVIQSGEPRHRVQTIPNTRVVVDLADPGIVIQKGVWQTALLLFIVLLGFLGLAAYVFARVLRPISILAINSRQLVPAAMRVTTELPYGDRNDEIGTLSTAFSDLLRETRERAEEARRKQAEEVRNRELNLKTIGHEIRSPLQALLGLHPPGDPSRHYIDRMVRAVKYLFTGTGPQSSFDSVPLVLEHLDVASFLVQLVDNSATAGISGVRYEGPTDGVICLVDPNALEDAVSHLLSNANRHRPPSTQILLKVTVVPAEVCIAISNEGKSIPEEFVERIFDLHFSQTGTREESNQGLGLFVTRNYVSRMSGSVAVRNRVNGVTFEIRLPVSRC